MKLLAIELVILLLLAVPTQASVEVVVNPGPGDVNADGSVDVSDLGILATYYGTDIETGWGEGDFTGDNRVDVNDLGILATNYGNTTPVPAGTPTPSNGSVVPEPSTLSIWCILGGLGMIVGRRRRKQLAL